ncbi:esterase-like protein [Novymonas esmeraldas]|uniref:Esterase-like protein n=1 Tax=Novymonas esmeraldas TaxID=1808958 RepID=A0AAW0ER66_9TRYP
MSTASSPAEAAPSRPASSPPAPPRTAARSAAATPAAGNGDARHAPRRGSSAVPRTPEMVVKVRDCPTSHMPIELCYQCFGDAADGLPVVLLIGGLNMQLYAWDEGFCESLVRAGFFVVRYDNRDIGHSTKVERCGRIKVPMLLLPGRAAKWLGEELPYQLEDMAADAWALLDALHIPCAHLFGISMGGMIAQHAALQAPERTISLTSVMSSTNAPDLPQPALWVKLWMLRRPPKNCTVEELLEFRVNSLRHLLRHALPPDGDYLKRRFVLSLRRSAYAAGLVRQAAAIRRATGRDSLLQQLRIPALVVHGAQDVVVPPMNGYRTATMLPYARMLVLKSMGHYFHPAFFSTIIAAFEDMAASTDPARRRLRSALPSVSAMEMPPSDDDKDNDGDGDGGDGGAAGEHAATQDAPAAASSESAEAPDAVGQADFVDASTRMMASLGEFIVPVVADAASPIGRAACLSVMVAVPGSNSNPAVPEAVIVENLFQRDPHATPSVPTAVVVRRPALPSATHRDVGTAPPVGKLVFSPLADRKRRASPTPPSSAASSSASLATAPRSSSATLVRASAVAVPKVSSLPSSPQPQPQPPRMDGAAPFVPCSPSRWHEVEPFPNRTGAAGGGSAAAGRPAASGGGANARPQSAVGGREEAASLRPSSAAAGSAATTEATALRHQPRVHPVVVGVTVEEHLRLRAATTASASPATAEAAATPAPAGTAAAAAAVAALAAPSIPVTGGAAEVVAVTAAAATAAHHTTSTASPPPPPPAAAAAADAAAAVVPVPVPPSPASSAPSEERRAEEEFLLSAAPPEVVDASSFAAL